MAEWSTITALPRDITAHHVTLRAMSKFVRRDKDDLSIRMLAEKILRDAGVRGHDHRREAATFLAWVQENIDYRRDPVETELVKDPAHILQTRAADCEELVELLATLCATVGLPSRFIASSTDGQDFDHCFLEVFVDGEWIPADPTNPGAHLGWRVDSRHADLVWPIFDGGESMNGLGDWDQFGNWYTPNPDGSTNWGGLIDTGIQTLPGILYAAQGVPYYGGVPTGRGINPGQIGAQASYNLGNQTAGFSLGLSPQTWQLLLIGAVAFLLLKKR